MFSRSPSVWATVYRETDPRDRLATMRGSIGPIVVAALLLLPACGEGDGPTGPDATTASSPPSAAEESPSEEPEELLPILTGPCCGGMPLDQGRHETPTWFSATFTIEVGERLSGVGAEPEQLVEIGRGRSSAGSLDHYVAFFAVEDADKVLREFRSTPRAEVGPAEPFVLGDLVGSQVDANAKPAPDDPADDEIAEGAIQVPALDRLTPAFFYTESRDARMRMLAIENGTTDLIVYVEAPPRDFDEFASEVEAMLASIEFLEP